MHLQKNGIKEKYQIASIIQNRHMDMNVGLAAIAINGQGIISTDKQKSLKINSSSFLFIYVINIIILITS